MINGKAGERSEVELNAIQLFASKPEKAVNALIDSGLIERTPNSVANYLFNTPELDKQMIGDYLGSPDDFNQQCLLSYLAHISFKDMEFDKALRFRFPFFSPLLIPPHPLSLSLLPFLSTPPLSLLPFFSPSFLMMMPVMTMMTNINRSRR